MRVINTLLLTILVGCVPSSSVQIERPFRFENYKTFASPRTYDTPGTIYRVTEQGQKLHVTVLKVPVRIGATSLVKSQSNANWSLTALAHYANLNFSGGNNGTREVAVALGAATAH